MNPSRFFLRFLIVPLLLAFAACPSDAATVSWTNTAGGAWEVPGNWSPSIVPAYTNVMRIYADGSYTVTISDTTADSYANTLTVTNLIMGDNVSDAMRVLVNYTNPAVLFKIGSSGSGNPGLYLYQGSPTFELASGTVQSDGASLRVGYAASANALLYIHGGSLSTTGGVVVGGNAVGSTGTILISSGSFYATNRNTSADYVTFGSGAGGYGSLVVSGGTVVLQHSGTTSTRVGYDNAEGRMLISGGDVNLLNYLAIGTGYSTVGTGLVVVTGGTLTWTNPVANTYFVVGAGNGNGTFVVSNTGVASVSLFYVGYGGTATGLAIVAEGGILDIPKGGAIQMGSLNGYGVFSNTSGGILRFNDNSPTINAMSATTTSFIHNATIEFRDVDAANFNGGNLRYFTYQGDNTIRFNGATNLGVTTYTFRTNNGSSFAFLDLVNGGVFRATNVTVGSGGKITGTGTILANAATNAGVLAPGHSPGTLTFSSNLVLEAASVVNIELGGTNALDYDHLVANGTLTLGGTLNVTLINGYTPNPGDVVDILDWGAILGTFSAVHLPSAEWSAENLYVNGTLLYAIPEPGIGLALVVGLGVMAWRRRPQIRG